MVYRIVAILAIAVMVSGFYSAYAHVTVHVGPYEIEVGWRDEPPLLNQQNAIVYKILEDGGGVVNAFRDLTATAKSGSASKQLDILSDTRLGHYYSRIIPTQMGPITVELKGTIGGVRVDEQIRIEDVESTNLLAFPPTTSGTQDSAHLTNAIASLQRDVAQIKSGGSGSGSGADLGQSYDFALFALGIGTAGVILAVISLIKRK